MSAPRRPPTSEIIVAGFHRSGTSSVTQLLHGAGLHVGNDLIGAMPSNPYGHYEDREVVRLHDRILEANGLTWQVTDDFVPALSAEHWRQMERHVERKRSRHRIWGFKDPRTCLFLGAWKHLMPDAKILVAFRPVADCSYSLARRHAGEIFTLTGPQHIHRRFFEEPDVAARMWITHNRALLDVVRRYPDDVLTVSFKTLLHGFPLVDMIRDQWRAPLQRVPTFSAVDPMATQRRGARQPLSDTRLAGEIDAVWAELVDLERATLAQYDHGLDYEGESVSANEYYVPDDIDALRMENELLALENEHLKRRVASLTDELDRAGKSQDQPESR